MYIIQTRGQILIPNFLLVTTVSWLPSKYKVRLATLSSRPSLSSLPLLPCPHRQRGPSESRCLAQGRIEPKALLPLKELAAPSSPLKSSGNIWECTHFSRQYYR